MINQKPRRAARALIAAAASACLLMFAHVSSAQSSFYLSDMDGGVAQDGCSTCEGGGCGYHASQLGSSGCADCANGGGCGHGFCGAGCTAHGGHGLMRHGCAAGCAGGGCGLSGLLSNAACSAGGCGLLGGACSGDCGCGHCALCSGLMHGGGPPADGSHCGLPAPKYPVPFATPRPTTPTYLMYPPMMPHNSLPHYRSTYSFRHGPGLSRTNVHWRSKKLLNVAEYIHHLFELPR